MDKLSVIRKSDLTEPPEVFPSSGRIYTAIWMLTKCMEKNLMAITQEYCEQYWTRPEYNTWIQHLTKQQLYGHLQPITKAIKVRRTKHAGNCWWSKDELISDILLWIPFNGRANVGRPARTYIQQSWANIGYSLENLLGSMDDRDGREEIQRDPCKQSDMMMMMMILFYQLRLFDGALF